jgi:hypothetical protein
VTPAELVSITIPDTPEIQRIKKGEDPTKASVLGTDSAGNTIDVTEECEIELPSGGFNQAGPYEVRMIYRPKNIFTNNSFKVYVMDDDKRIQTFKFQASPGGPFVGAIDEAGGTISVTVPYGTNLSALTPEVVFIGEDYGPRGEQDFRAPVDYMVWAEDGSIKTYKVTVAIEPRIVIEAEAITNWTIPELSFSLSSANVKINTPIAITLREDKTADWIVKIEEKLFSAENSSGITVAAFGALGSYSVAVIASVDGIAYAGNFMVMVVPNEE